MDWLILDSKLFSWYGYLCLDFSDAMSALVNESLLLVEVCCVYYSLLTHAKMLYKIDDHN